MEERTPPLDIAADKKTDDKPAVKKRRNWFGSLKIKTSFTFIAFAAAILVILWAIFLIFIFGVYGRMLENDLAAVGDAVAARVPSAIEDVDSLQATLSDHAQRDSVSITVFTVGEDGIPNAPIINIDTFGNSIDTEKPESFDAIIADIDFDDVFVKRGGVGRVSTEMGDYMCYGAKRNVSLNGEHTELYILVAEPDDLFNSQTMILIYALVVITAVVLVGAIISSIFMSDYQIRLLRGFSRNAKRLAEGDFDAEFSGGGYEEYDNLASALNAAKDSIKKTEALQRDMIANVSHDIRTPLTMIRAYAEMLRDMPLDPEKRERTAEIIIAESDRLDALTADILNLSKLQAGVVEFKYEPLYIGELAYATLVEFEIFRTRDGVKFETDIDDNALAVCDSSRIFQVFYNLIINAINYSGDDKTVIVRVKNKENAVRVEVADHGKGIEPDELDNVWDRYYRSAHTKRSAVGSGLGLSICKSILEAHKAEYGVTSELGKGTTFWFELATKND
ncbi:MAG: HAMP domain-containing histidine kinase [Clostridiales bacterium]|nr:HAMP domain-containing histidine kinase [Clostridiales bacterium]